MPRYGIHFAANDQWGQVLYLEADLVQEPRGFVLNPEVDTVEVKWSGQGHTASGILYVDDDATTNTLEWIERDAATNAERSRTTLFAKAPNGSWRALNVGSKIVLGEPGFGYEKAVYVVQAIMLLE